MVYKIARKGSRVRKHVSTLHPIYWVIESDHISHVCSGCEHGLNMTGNKPFEVSGFGFGVGKVSGDDVRDGGHRPKPTRSERSGWSWHQTSPGAKEAIRRVVMRSS